MQPNFIEGLGSTEVALWVSNQYTCLEPYFEVLWAGIPLAIGRGIEALSAPIGTVEASH